MLSFGHNVWNSLHRRMYRFLFILYSLVVLHEIIHFIPQVCDLKKNIFQNGRKWVFKFGISVLGGGGSYIEGSGRDGRRRKR